VEITRRGKRRTKEAKGVGKKGGRGRTMTTSKRERRWAMRVGQVQQGEERGSWLAMGATREGGRGGRSCKMVEGLGF